MEIRELCLKQGQGLNARAAPPYPSICRVPHSPGCDRVFRSKTSLSNASFNSRSDGLRCDFSTNKLKISMSNMSFPNFNSRSDGLRYNFSTKKLKYSSYLSTSEPRGKDSAPRIFRVFIRPPAKFRQSFAYLSAVLCAPCS